MAINRSEFDAETIKQCQLLLDSKFKAVGIIFDPTDQIISLSVYDQSGTRHMDTGISDMLDFADLYDTLYILLKRSTVVFYDAPKSITALNQVYDFIQQPRIDYGEVIDIRSIWQQGVGKHAQERVVPDSTHAEVILGIIKMFAGSKSSIQVEAQTMGSYSSVGNWVDLGDIRANVTVRQGADANMLKETLRHYIYLSRLLRSGTPNVVDDAFKSRSSQAVPEGEEKVIVWGDLPLHEGGQISIRRFSEATTVQDVLDMVWGFQTVIANIQQAMNGVMTPHPTITPPQTPPPPAQQTPPPAGQQHRPSVQAFITATKAPNTKKVEYQNGQHVKFNITRINLSTQNNSVVWQLWSPLGKNFPVATIFQDNEHAMEAVGTALNTLGLSMAKLSVEGSWDYVVTVYHKTKDDGSIEREFLNPYSLTPAAPAQQQPPAGQQPPAFDPGPPPPPGPDTW